jgi:hypothetical protein
MRRRHPDLHFVALTEEEAMCATRNYFGESDININFLLDVWLRMQHFRGADEPLTTDDGVFQSIAYFQCAQSPYTLLSTYQLWRRAYYLESAILLRHVLEIFITLRYFKDHPNLYMNHITAQPKGRVRFETMFEELSPGSYDIAYRKLSTIAHGNINFGFRSDLSAVTGSGEERVVTPFVGSHFDQDLAMLIHGFYTSIALGFLNYYDRFFPGNTIATDAALLEDIKDTQQWLISVFNYKKTHVRDPALFEAFEKLVVV